MGPNDLEITRPIVIVQQTEDGKGNRCVLFRPPGWRGFPPEKLVASFGLVACDLIRHIAQALGCHEDVVFDWVERERRNPTATITGQRVN